METDIRKYEISVNVIIRRM